MTGSQTPLFGLKFRLTLMMGVLLFASLALIYVLNLQGERELMAAVHETLEALEDEVNKAWKEYAAQRDAEEVAAVDAAPQGIWLTSPRPRHYHLQMPEWSFAMPDGEQMRERMARTQVRLGEALRRFEQQLADTPFVEIKVIQEKPAPEAGLATRTGAKLVTIPRRHLDLLAERERHDSRARFERTSLHGGAPEDRPNSATAAEPTASLVAEGPDFRRRIDVYISPLATLVEDLRLRSILIVLGVFLLGMVLSWALASRFTAPIENMKLAFGRVAAGDLREPDLPPRSDEIGQMGKSFAVMTKKLRETRELEKRVAEQERFTTLGHLAAGVAHDVRNPLNAIGLTIDHMQDEFCPEEPDRREAYRHYSHAIKAEIARLEHLVNNFLTLAKPPALELRPADLGALIEDMLDLVRKEAESRGIEVVTELAGDLPPVVLDPERTRAAMMNLVLNALQAIEDEGKITIRTEAVGREALVSIEDDGRGIAAEDLGSVFLPYWTTRDEGTGLGLAVSRATVEGHGGRIEIASQVGHGTTVTVALPLGGPDRS